MIILLQFFLFGIISYVSYFFGTWVIIVIHSFLFFFFFCCSQQYLLLYDPSFGFMVFISLYTNTCSCSLFLLSTKCLLGVNLSKPSFLIMCHKYFGCIFFFIYMSSFSFCVCVSCSPSPVFSTIVNRGTFYQKYERLCIVTIVVKPY